MLPVGSSLDQWLSRLETFSPQEIDLGLERVLVLLQRLDLELPASVFHIAGTNGKGSTVTMLESLLLKAGSSVGSYLSPHIIRYNERIRVNGEEALDADIVTAFERIEALRDGVPLTYFEFGTLAALLVFADAGVDVAILEVGMGGRLDAVNAVEPTAGLITNISLDHCDWLGNDVETIAAEKAGIMRTEKPIVFASRQMPASIAEQADRVGAKLVAAGRHYDWSDDGDSWSWRGGQHRLANLDRPALLGDIQLQNAAGVLALVESAGLGDLLREDLINTAFADLALRGRMQVIAAEGQWLLDVAHNPAAAAALADTLRSLPTSGRTVAIIGMLDDKDVEGVLLELGDEVEHWIALTADNPRAIAAAELARRVANATSKACLVAATPQQAIDQARLMAAPKGRTLVTGSFYLVGPLLTALELYSPRQGT